MSISAATPRRSLIPEWLRSAWGIALLFTGIYVLLYSAFSLVQFGGGELGAALANITYLPVGLIATIFAWRIAASKRYERQLRLAWLLIGLGIFSQFAGDVSWLVMESILGIEPYPSIADVFYLGTYPFLMWGLLSLPMQKAKSTEQARFLFDALIAIVSGALLMWYFLIRPAVEAAEGDVLSALVGASYPIGDLILLIGVVVLSYRHSDVRISGSVKYLALGVVLFLAADVIYAFIAEDYISGMWLDSLWLGAFIMFSTAAVYQAQVLSESLSKGWTQRIERAMRVVITLISFGSYVWMIYALSTQETDSLTQIILLGSGLALSALLVSRQWLTVRENQALLKQSLADRAEVEELSQSLEQRVAERTNELLVAADVVRRVSVVRDIDQLLLDAVNTIAERFNLYYVQIYLLDEQAGALVLKTGSGAVGNILRQKGHRLALASSSLNATAAHEKRSVLVADTRKSDTFRANPLLPETRCELSVPLIFQQRVLGVLDIQGSQPSDLNQEKVPVFEALAGQLAISIENSNLHARSSAAMQRAEEQAALLTRAGWRAFLDGIHRSERLGYLAEGERIEPADDLPEADPGLSSMQEPIIIAGQTVGWLQVEGEQVDALHVRELVNWAAEQTAQKLENLRLLAQAEQYRQEAEQVVQRLTREGWQAYQDSLREEQLGYIYDQQSVARLTAEGNGYHERALLLPLQLHEEQIGELGVVSASALEEEDLKLVETIAGQLSTHLENLRLLEETRRAEDELANRAAEMVKVAELATQVTTQTEVAELLQSLVDQTKESFGLYHAHIYLMDERGDHLNLAAGAGEVGRTMVMAGWQISAASEKSLVARAARTRQAVIVNDVRADPEFLPNELLPETRSEMAVPLVVGNRVLGVLDVQSDRVERFSTEDASIQTTLASQVAVALQNAQLFQRTQQQAEREASINTISQRIQATTSVEEALQVAVRELGRTLGAQRATIQLGVPKREPHLAPVAGGNGSSGSNGAGKNGQ